MPAALPYHSSYPPYSPDYISSVLQPSQKQFNAFPCDLNEIKKYSVDNGYLGEWDILFIWASLLEQLTFINLKEENELFELIKTNQNQYEISTEHQVFLWKNKQTGVTGRTVIGFISDYFEIPFQNAVATLAKYFKFTLEHIFNVGDTNCESSVFLPMAFQDGNWTFNLLESNHFSQDDGISICQINGKVIPLQVGFWDNQPIIGGKRKTHWLNQELLVRNHAATIVLFADIIVAIDIIGQFQQHQGETEKYIFTACPHWDFEKMNFSFFEFRTVLLVYSSTTFPTDKLKALSQKLKDKVATIKYCDCEISNGKYSMNNLENLLQAKKGA